MEKYQKTICFFILFAFFTAISFYVQKATDVVLCYLTPLRGGGTVKNTVLDFVLTQVVNIIQ